MVMTKLRMFKNQKKKAPPTHIAQMITIKTRKNLDAMWWINKLSSGQDLTQFGNLIYGRILNYLHLNGDYQKAKMILLTTLSGHMFWRR